MASPVLPLFIGLGPAELILIVAVLALLLGGSRLSSLAQSGGRAIGEYKKERQEIEQEITDVKTDIESDVSEVHDEIEEEVNDVQRDIEEDVTEVQQDVEQDIQDASASMDPNREQVSPGSDETSPDNH